MFFFLSPSILQQVVGMNNIDLHVAALRRLLVHDSRRNNAAPDAAGADARAVCADPGAAAVPVNGRAARSRRVMRRRMAMVMMVIVDARIAV